MGWICHTHEICGIMYLKKPIIWYTLLKCTYIAGMYVIMYTHVYVCMYSTLHKYVTLLWYTRCFQTFTNGSKTFTNSSQKFVMQVFCVLNALLYTILSLWACTHPCINDDRGLVVYVQIKLHEEQARVCKQINSLKNHA